MSINYWNTIILLYFKQMLEAFAPQYWLKPSESQMTLNSSHGLCDIFSVVVVCCWSSEFVDCTNRLTFGLHSRGGVLVGGGKVKTMK